jgi:8-oxo-dGTP pyrophosphatase MutT (NUDIX family)
VQTADAVAVVRANLLRFRRRAAQPTPDTRRAAVSITLLPHRGEAHVLLLKRVAFGRNAGQWALPGGRLDSAETPVEGALRELQEETGVTAAPDGVVGLLDDFVTDSGFLITPVVVAPTQPVRPARNPAEVHSLHPIAVSRLLDPELPRWRRQPDGTLLLQLPLRRGMVVHAPTGALLWQFREVALLGRPTRVADAAQPSFSRR